MAIAHHTSIGSMAEDRLWTAYCSWAELQDLFNDPQTWVKTLKDNNKQQLNSVLADGVITIVMHYPLNQNGQQPAYPLVVQGGDHASVIHVRALSTDGMPDNGLEFDDYVPVNTALAAQTGETRLSQDKATQDVQADETIMQVPEGTVTATLRKENSLGFVHLPIKTKHIGDLFAKIAQNPQRLVVGLQAWDRRGGLTAVYEVEGTGVGTLQPKGTAFPMLVDLVPGARTAAEAEATGQQDLSALQNMSIVYQTGCPAKDSLCLKAAGAWTPSNGIRIDTITGYCYAQASPVPNK